MSPYTHAVTLEGVRRWEELRARIRAMDPFRVDVLIAAVFAVVCVVELLLIDPDGPRGLTFAAGVVAMSSLAFRRRNAMVAGALFVVPVFGQMVAGGYLTTNSTTPFVAVLFLLYSVGRYAPASRFLAATALIMGGTSITIFLEDGFEPDEVFWSCFLFALPVLAGRALHSRALLQAELRAKAEAAERQRAERARGAVEDERARIAAELQALVANGLSAMVVQAETVPRTLDAGDFVGARTAFTAVEETGRDALTEMRRLLGVLRRDSDGAELAPQPGLARVETLVERNSERGLEVDLRVEGTRRELSPGVDLTAYRVVEDALEAATENGADRAEVLLRYKDDELQLQVSDDREGDGSEHLPGLRDRVGLYGGNLRADRTDDGSYRLRARLPLEGDALMLRRLRGVSEANWRVLDRLFVALLIAASAADLIWNDLLEGPLAANLAVMTAISVSFLWRRSLPHVVAAITLGGLLVMANWLTMPPDLFVAIVMLLSAAYSTGRHLEGRKSIVFGLAGAAALTTIAAIYDPDDVFFPVMFFWVIPWVMGRTIRNQTMLARELAEKAERAAHEREEDERRAIAVERSRIARELHDVLAHNLSVMVVQASAARRIVDRNPAQAAEVAELIQRTGREALAEIRHLFGAVRRGDGEDLSGPPSITRVEELAAARPHGRPRGRAARPGRPGRAAHRDRPHGVPDRAGGAHERAQARRQRAARA